MNETDLNNQTQKEQSQKEQRQQKNSKLRESMFILILINQITQSKRY